MKTFAIALILIGGAATAVAAPPSPPKSAAPAAPEIVTRLQKFYEATRDLHAKFEQVVESGTGRKRVATGEVWLKKPGRMRWEYQKPEKKLMVADGESLWVYEPEDEQAFRQGLSASSLPTSVSFLVGQGKLAEEFQITVEKEAIPGGAAAKPGEVVLKLVPHEATAQYRYLLFVVDEKTAMVTGTVIYDQQGGTSRMSFRDIEANRGVKDDKFQFKPPAGTRILRQ